MSDKLNATLTMLDNSVKYAPSKKYKYDPATKDDITNYLLHNTELMKLPKIKLDDVCLVNERINLYYNICLEHKVRPSASGLACALGITTQTLFNIKNEQTRVGKPESEIIKQGYQMLEMMWEDYMLNNKIHPVAGIFLAKNQFNYVDSREVVVQPRKVEEVDHEAMRRKYLGEIPEAEIVEEKKN